MIDIQKVYEESYKELKALGIPVNPATVQLSSSSEITGKCQEQADSTFVIKIMKRLAVNNQERLLKSTMIHELIHTCRDTYDHDEKYREYTKIAEDYGHYGLFEAPSRSEIHGEDRPIKRLYACPKCGLSYKSTHDDEGELKCPWCNTKMNHIDFVS